MQPAILLVEDEPSISEPLTALLQREGYSVQGAKTLSAARASINGADLVLLDWMLPDGQGIDALREWRAHGRTLPVVFLTARADTIDKVLGLELGADDYVTKPFDPRELLARVKARLRVPARAPAALAASGIVMDDELHEVTFCGTATELTRMEYALLKLFLENRGKVFTRDEILNQVWGYESFPTTRTVDTHVLQLRQKFHHELFETVRGVGYRMRKEDLTSN